LRRYARKIQVGKIAIGGDSAISIQSMTKTRTNDIDATIAQILQLEQAGCDIVRVAVPDELAARSISSIKNQINIPLVADIHFDCQLAIMSIEAGADKIRINPGNIGHFDKIKQILAKAKDNEIPIRIGVNAGSLEKDLLKKYSHPCAEALVESAMRHIRICEDFSFDNLIISLKSSDVNMMIDAYRLIAQRIDYPLHVGVSEAGLESVGLIKSAIGIGSLLKAGIGDTIRVSLTSEPVKEIKVGIEILRALKLKTDGASIISCPTCGRTEVDLFTIVNKVEKQVAQIKKPIKIAIMGCTVNGPGEAREADIGIACGHEKAVLFKKGKAIKKIPEEEIIQELLKEVTEHEYGSALNQRVVNTSLE
jgi:(E)-4-hydroxy-3-methylbut-2-enyl-diphosphate synthase